MRIALVVHSFPPEGMHGVEHHTELHARALALAGVEVEVLALRDCPGLAAGSQRREQREHFGVTWLQVGEALTERERREALRSYLERERPDVVHFQHVAGFGPDALAVPRALGIPSLYTAHDFYLAHEIWTLLRPDLTPFECGDYGAEARALRACGFLDKLPALGDHHRTLLEAQVGPGTWSRLMDILDGEVTSELEGIERVVLARAERYREALAQVDRLYATSRFLASQLTGVLGRAVAHQPSGIDLTLDVAPSSVPNGPLRVGFLGGLLKHKGPHVLLEAKALLGDAIEVHLHGGSGDHVYRSLIEARAAEVGATCHGSFAPRDLATILDSIDVVVVPSLWVENAPYVIREAYAAGKVVLASDTEALRESVEDGVSGLLFPAGDEQALARVLESLLEDEGLLERLRSGIEAPLAIEQEVAQYQSIYGELVAEAAGRRETPLVPACVEPIRRRIAELEALPTRELFGRVLEGLGRLSKCMGVEEDALSLLKHVVGAGSATRDLVLDHDRELRWLRTSLRDVEAARDEMERRAAWFAEQLSDLQKKARWVEERLEQEERTVGVERDWLRETIHDLQEERDWLRGEQVSREQADSWLRETLAASQGEVEDLRGQVAAGEQARRALEEESAWLRQCLEGVEAEVQALREERQWLGESAEAVEAERQWLQSRVETAEAEAEGARASQAGAQHALDSLREERDWLREVLAARQQELRWIREQLTGEASEDDESSSIDPKVIHDATLALRGELSALKRHGAWMQEELAGLARAASRSPLHEPGPQFAPRQFEAVRSSLARLESELRWRRSEMDAAREASQRLLTRLAVPGLTERLKSWEAAPPSPASERAVPQVLETSLGTEGAGAEASAPTTEEEQP